MAAPGNDDPFGEFAGRFAEAWSAPTATRLGRLLCDDVVLEQPMAPTARGRAAAESTLGSLIELIPDIHAEVQESWGGAGGGAITFDLVGTLGGRELRWHLVDVFELRGGLVARRISYFDPGPLITAIITRPRAWIPFARSGVWRR